MLIIYHDNLSDDRDFLFKLQYVYDLNNEDEVFVHIINSFLFFV